MKNFIQSMMSILSMRNVRVNECCVSKDYNNELKATDLVGAIDDLEHAINFAHSSSNPIAQGLEIVMSKFKKIASNGGLEFSNPTGQQFDPNQHSAVDYRQSDKDEGEIVMVLQSGYSVNGKIVRFPQVVVSSGK